MNRLRTLNQQKGGDQIEGQNYNNNKCKNLYYK